MPWMEVTWRVDLKLEKQKPPYPTKLFAVKERLCLTGE